MKNIAIVTFNKAHNYGAVLQAYALKVKLDSLGHSTKFYNYDPRWINEHYSFFPVVKNENLFKNIKRKAGYIIDIKRRYTRYKGFNDFINNNLPIWSNDELKSIDCLVIGSDQVWNPKITCGFDAECFGVIENISKANVVSYAASMEGLSLDNPEKIEFSRLIKNFDHVGVRESSLKTYLEELDPNMIVNHNLDPTLLLNSNDWLKLVENEGVSSNYEDDYVLVYENYKTGLTSQIAQQVADKYNLKVRTITTGASWRHGKDIETEVSPTEFVSLFSDAKFVITTSYHGLAFSINFGVQFVCLKVKGGVNNRALSLLNVLNLEDNIYDAETFDINSYKHVNYEGVNKKLNEQRVISTKFLSDSIG
ncbi:polysaccharide pyruvyl transferase family protein [Vibrio fluvialis]|nr:polysaccharide pyruvyl transferase family protein [Vibrio fluvialis]MBY8294988.1 polysaccharide pyruvyl transferase family protein [Vibrio fluvialis]MBY8311706.1 polysaccharide pyruvyl transferase family protein [Vibrio fluvialis]